MPVCEVLHISQGKMTQPQPCASWPTPARQWVATLRRYCVGAQSMGGNGLIVSFGEVMPMRLGRLQRQSRRAFWASAAPEVSTSELAGWCWARQTLMEKRAPSRWQRESMIRAARSIGAVRTRRIGREWLWLLPDAVARWR
jgi:hypothetical protein